MDLAAVDGDPGRIHLPEEAAEIPHRGVEASEIVVAGDHRQPINVLRCRGRKDRIDAWREALYGGTEAALRSSPGGGSSLVGRRQLARRASCGGVKS